MVQPPLPLHEADRGRREEKSKILRKGSHSCPSASSSPSLTSVRDPAAQVGKVALSELACWGGKRLEERLLPFLYSQVLFTVQVF